MGTGTRVFGLRASDLQGQGLKSNGEDSSGRQSQAGLSRVNVILLKVAISCGSEFQKKRRLTWVPPMFKNVEETCGDQHNRRTSLKEYNRHVQSSQLVSQN